MSNPTLYVRIVSPKQTLFAGEALAVSSTNSAGKFDILPHHANFLTLTEDVPISILTPDRKKVEFKFPLTIIYNTDNKVNIYTDILPQTPK